MNISKNELKQLIREAISPEISRIVCAIEELGEVLAPMQPMILQDSLDDDDD